MKYLFALDLSLSNTGVSIFSNDGCHVLTKSIDTKSGKDHQMKLKIIGDGLLELRKKYVPEIVIIEKGFTRFNLSTQALYKCAGLAQYLFYDVEQVFLAATTIKKEITGKGNAKKDEVRDCIVRMYPTVSFENYDQSDSYAIAVTYLKRKGVL
jgi:Holliday junction resolvasome RuvABC endonuclease subunit